MESTLALILFDAYDLFCRIISNAMTAAAAEEEREPRKLRP